METKTSKIEHSTIESQHNLTNTRIDGILKSLNREQKSVIIYLVRGYSSAPTARIKSSVAEALKIDNKTAQSAIDSLISKKVLEGNEHVVSLTRQNGWKVAAHLGFDPKFGI